MHHRVGLHETDAAGVMFAGHIVTLAHSMYEQALATAGCDIAALIRNGEVGLPLIRCEADFRAPIRHGDQLSVAVTLAEQREHGYQVVVTLHCNNTAAAAIKQTHVCIDSAGSKTALPPAVRAALDAL
ncbi:MAG: acyl-CoA thioesterase [Planctomycetota bacterium]|jgi:1,4-dihydroxy-2-naphthoyl-CoA hydrolase|nr:acyl-CoA thioesterase [Planctomycetota bacterium]